MPYKVSFISLGCAKNQVNAEQMMALVRQAGHTLTGDPKELKRASDALARRGFSWQDISAALRRYGAQTED